MPLLRSRMAAPPSRLHQTCCCDETILVSSDRCIFPPIKVPVTTSRGVNRNLRSPSIRHLGAYFRMACYLFRSRSVHLGFEPVKVRHLLPFKSGNHANRHVVSAPAP